MRGHSPLLCMLAWIAGVAWEHAQTPPATVAPAQSRAERLAAIETEFQAAQAAYWKLFEGAKTDEQAQRIATEHAGEAPDARRWAERVWALVEEQPADDVACSALAWILENLRDDAHLEKALTTLVAHHLQDPKLGQICSGLVYDWRPATRSFLTAVLEKCSLRAVQGIACYALAKRVLADAEMAQRLRDDPNEAEGLEGHLGADAVAELRALDPQKSRATSERLFERVISEFGDVESGRRKLADAAQDDLFELRHLSIGCVAPEIEGNDLDGVAFKLSDYRGKLVVLDFWGNW